MVRAVIFDLDDTLISEKQYIKSGYQRISKFLSNRFDKDENEIYQILTNIFNESSLNVFNRLFDEFGIIYKGKDIMELVEEYRNHLPTIEFFEDVLPCLEDLKKKGIKVGIITDGYANAQRHKLNAVKAFDYFDEILITDELGREYWKPHPKSFEIMKKKMNVEFNEMIYIGDNPKKDFYIGEIYPIKTVKIERSNGVYKGAEYYQGIKYKYRIDSLGELKIILNNYGFK
jgi:putative hydrolase of the HAD superfamily